MIDLKAPVALLPNKFDIEKILFDLPGDIIASQRFQETGQLAVTHSPNYKDLWFDGCGSLYNYQEGKFFASTSEYYILNSRFLGTYLEQVVQEVRGVASSEGVGIGRIRLMDLKPRSCYTLHQDPEDYRFHIPLKTNEKCFFVVDDQVYKMPEVGSLYRFKTNSMHTAVNASRDTRYHLLFDTYSFLANGK